MNIYLSNTTNFSNNGLGFLTDIISANVIDELNGNYELQLVYIRDGKLSEYLVEENIIKCKVSDSTYQLFRITNVEKTFKTITIIAKHIFYDLLNNFLENTYPQNLSCQLFLQHILDHTNFSNSFTAVSDISTTKTARYVRMNPVSAIIGDNNNSMVNLFGGELKRDNFTINFLSRVGSNNGVKLLIGKNITGINISIDITSMATRIMPQGFDGLLLPELYVDSPLINNYPTPKIVKIEFSDVVYDPDVENAYHDIQDAYAELRRRAEEQYSLGIDKPKINIKIDWIELSKTEEYKSYQNLERVNLGDTITAYILGINYETRVISTNYDVLKDMIVDFEIGTVKPSITSSMSKIQKSVEEINPDSILKTAKDEATELITTAMGGYVYKTESELYIMNTNDPTTATKVWRWNINGLGYSSTGINGPYGIAMTMDGAIVADYITTGTLNTSVIQGYDSIVTTVSGISTTYETKTDATSKLNTAKTYADGVSSTAETNAKNYTDNELDNITNTIDETEVGNPLYIENAQNEKPIEFELYGDTFQTTYSGKNLYDKTQFTWTSSLTYQSIYVGIGTYTMSSPNMPSNTTRNLFFLANQVATGAASGTNGVDLGVSRTVTSTDGYVTIAGRTTSTGNTNNPSNYDFMIEKNNTKTEYEPYVGGIASPNPDYPQDVKVVTGRQTIDLCGKNLYDTSYRSNNTIFTNYCTATEENGLFTLTATGTDMFIWGVKNTGDTYDTNRGKLYEFESDNYVVSISNSLFTKNYVTFYDENKVSLGYVQKSSNIFTFSKNDKTGAKYFTLRFGYGSAVSGTTYKFTVQMEKGTQATEYEQYNGNTYEIDLGKNLLKFDLTTAKLYNTQGSWNNNVYSYCGINATINENNTITLSSGTTTSNYNFYLYKNEQGKRLSLPAGTYTFSTNTSPGNGNGNLVIQIKDNNGNTISGVSNIYFSGGNSASNTKTINQDFQIAIYIQIPNNSIESEKTYKIQIEKNTTATTYTPYKEPIELCKIGDYQDKIFKRDNRWYLRKETGKVILKGNDNENWAKTSPQELTNTNYFYSDIIDGLVGTLNVVYSNYFKNVSGLWNNDVEGIQITTNSSNIRVRINKTIASTTSAFKNWLSTHNTNVYYILATPTEEPIADEELISQLDAFELITGINNITNTSFDLAGNMYLKYYLHTPISDTYVNKVELNSKLKITSESISTEVSSKYYTKTDVDGQVSGLNKTITDNKETLDTTKSNLKTLQDNYTTFTTETYQSDKDILFNFRDNITNNGVAKVKTETGFKFDKDGLNISSNVSDTNTTIDTTGLYVNTNIGNINMLTANTEGVTATNLTAKNYLITSPIRGEKVIIDNEIRYGYFWLGDD